LVCPYRACGGRWVLPLNKAFVFVRAGAKAESGVSRALLTTHPGLELCVICDCEAEADNPVESK
jgi:hypothetical protein